MLGFTLDAAMMTAADVPTPQAVGLVLARALIDLAGMSALTFALFFPRHYRRDLVTVFWLFNVAVFAVLLVIDTGAISVGAGLGLFGVLSIVRLRSEQYRNIEIGYFFVALSLALVNGLAPHLALSLGLSAGILVVVLVLDAGWLLPATSQVEMVLDRVIEDEAELHAELAARLRATVLEVSVTQIDYVRLLTTLSVQVRDAPRTGARSARSRLGAR